MDPGIFTSYVSYHVWDTKYRCRDIEGGGDRSILDTWQRVAHAVAQAEKQNRDDWAERFYQQLEGFRFLPGGRILAGAGAGVHVTLFNCFVMGHIADSMDGIFDALKEGALTMQQGGGVGYDFSTLRPRGMRARTTGTVASGPVSFMRIWDSMCATILSTGARRGAMMGALRCDHPDIEAFIEAKREKTQLRHFNLSVLVTDAFMEAVRHDRDWSLVFPDNGIAEGAPGAVMRDWPGYERPVKCRVLETIRARALWAEIIRSAYDCAEPGVLFIDRINRNNNLGYLEKISATNPCGEIPLPPYGACNLGSLNLTRFVEAGFTPHARFTMHDIAEATEVAVRFLDNVVDVSNFPLAAQAEQARRSRRIGLGLTGLADALMMLGLDYDSDAARRLAGSIMATISHSAYRASVELAKEKGAFPSFQKEAYLESPFVGHLPVDIRRDIGVYGIRNSHLTAIAPTGTVSLLANNISSGLEPVFSDRYQRRIAASDGSYDEYDVVDYAVHRWQQTHGIGELPPAFVGARSLRPEAHLLMQAALQPYVDSAISKTVNVPEDFPLSDFSELYEKAYELGLKGCTAFRPNPITNAILKTDTAQPCQWCTPEREAD